MNCLQNVRELSYNLFQLYLLCYLFCRSLYYSGELEFCFGICNWEFNWIGFHYIISRVREFEEPNAKFIFINVVQIEGRKYLKNYKFSSLGFFNLSSVSYCKYFLLIRFSQSSFQLLLLTYRFLTSKFTSFMTKTVIVSSMLINSFARNQSFEILYISDLFNKIRNDSTEILD